MLIFYAVMDFIGIVIHTPTVDVQLHTGLSRIREFQCAHIYLWQTGESNKNLTHPNARQKHISTSNNSTMVANRPPSEREMLLLSSSLLSSSLFFFWNNNFCVCEQMFYARREVPFFSIACDMCCDIHAHGIIPLEVSHPSMNSVHTRHKHRRKKRSKIH